MKIYSIPILAAVAFALPGCSGGLLAPSGPEARLYMLKAPSEIASAAAQANWQLLIQIPDAQLALNAARIMIAPSPSRIDYYADVAWADRPPAMLQELLLQSFEKSGRIGAVQRQSGGLKADFILASDLQDFQVDAASGAVKVRLTMRLIKTANRTIVATRSFDADIATNGNFEGAIAAFNGALGQILPQIVDWTLTQGSRNF